jgi:hypothetical protein
VSSKKHPTYFGADVFHTPSISGGRDSGSLDSHARSTAQMANAAMMGLHFIVVIPT